MPPNTPPPTPSPNATILNYLNDSEREAPLSFVGFWRPTMTPPQTPQYLTILMTERGGGRHYHFLGFWRPPMPPHDSKILYYLNDTDEGRYYFCRILAPPPMPPPPPDATILSYLTDREGGGGRALPFVGFWRPPPRRHNT